MPSGYGHFKISVKYYHTILSATTTNTQAIDRYRNIEVPRKAHADWGMTHKQSYEMLFNEIIRANPERQRVQVNTGIKIKKESIPAFERALSKLKSKS
jgi:hypothetical protein